MKTMAAVLLALTTILGYAFWTVNSDSAAVKSSPSLSVALWHSFAEKFIEHGRVIDRDNNNISHSEGQGYGMLLAEAAGDQAAFNQLWTWTQRTLQRPDGLFSWKYEPCAEADRRCVTDENNASDAELLIAWALLKAHARWGDDDYVRQARRIADAVVEKLVIQHHERLILVPGVSGFVEGEQVTINPSYWVFPALDALAKAFPDHPWQALNQSGRALLPDISSGHFRLPPDWVDLSTGGSQPSAKFPARYSYDAVRVPLYLAWSTAGITVPELMPYQQFWAAFEPTPAWISLEDEVRAEYAWSTGMQAIAALAQARQKRKAIAPQSLPTPNQYDGYFSWSLLLLTHVALAETAQVGQP